MSAKGKSRSKRHDWSVHTTDGQYHYILNSRLERHRDGGHVFTDRRGIRASFGPGQIATVFREDIGGERAISQFTERALELDDDPRKHGAATAVSGA